MVRRKGTHKKKVTLAWVRKLPLWLRRLDRVKAELKGTRFPRTADEGFRQCVALSTTSLRWLRDSIRKNHPNASEEQLELEKRRLLARLSAVKTGGWSRGGRSEHVISDSAIAKRRNFDYRSLINSRRSEPPAASMEVQT
jgi:hypothetical protein